jgi:hypothetical protein
VPVSFRLLAATAVAGAAMTVPLAGAAATAATHAPVRAVGAPSPGLTGPPITLDTNADLTGGYDAATSASGTTYIAWISDLGNANRTVHLCVLPPGKTACAGGIQSTSSLSGSSAAGIHVIVAGSAVTLVWFHDTAQSVNGPEGAKIATAAVQNGVLSAAHDQAPAPSFGTLEDVAAGPGGTIWTVTVRSGVQSVQVIPGLGNQPVTVGTPYLVSTGQGVQLAFDGSVPVMVIQMGGAISQPIAYASERNGKWSSFTNVAHTWTAAANLGLAQTKSGIRALASVDNASYQPVVSRWTGTAFAPPQLTGDKNACAPASHDPVADASGRMADISMECGDVAIANLTDTLHAGIVRFSNGGVFGGGPPQLATTPRGLGWAVWSIQASTNDTLKAGPVLLPGRDSTAQATGQGNQVKLTGPASCLPPVGVPVKVAGTPASGWQVSSSALALDGTALSGTTLDGSTLTAGSAHTLTGKVTFSKGGTHLPVTATLKFTSCPNP